ncbi:hypothetical protein [Pseudobdellovibrio exovorus]|uniref:Peptidase M48 domain-containing protein n=1 Tax=Pseudobdellovibrio exovorus JSS TaxID=1184267 RepID=M4VCL2_9BACT|nr:hypothetical protein [Pseudobdellovibrio exovorus]AGH95776.1 hypothetical protein A11Q_1560 [Pseudobdellovibrio exovorus JSS]
MLKMLLITTFFFFTAELTQAVPNGTDTGGGGYGAYVQPESRMYLYDLYEAQIHRSPYIHRPLQPRTDFTNAVTTALGHLSYIPHDLVAIKLEEIAQANELLAYVITRAITFHSWNDDSEPVLLLHDLRYHKITIPENVRLLASRYHKDITLSKTYTALLNPENLAALVLHEALYALTGDAVTTRHAVAYLFSKSAHQEKYKKLMQKVSLLRRSYAACDIYSKTPIKVVDAVNFVYKVKSSLCKISFYHSSEFFIPEDPDAGAAVLRRYVLRTEMMTAAGF